MRYRVQYDSSYRDKEWVTLYQDFDAKSDREAVNKAHKFVTEFDKDSRRKSGGLERCFFKAVLKIIQEARPEKTALISGGSGEQEG